MLAANKYILLLLTKQDPITGEVDPELEREAKEKYQQELAVHQRVIQIYYKDNSCCCIYNIDIIFSVY